MGRKSFNIEEFDYDPATKVLSANIDAIGVPWNNFEIIGRRETKRFRFALKNRRTAEKFVYVYEDENNEFACEFYALPGTTHYGMALGRENEL